MQEALGLFGAFWMACIVALVLVVMAALVEGWEK